MKLKDPMVRSRGRPRKQWKNIIEEDLREMNLRETDAMDRVSWRAAMKWSNLVA